MPGDQGLGQIGTGGGQLCGADQVIGGAAGDRIGPRERQFVQEGGVGCGQVEGDRVGGVIGDNPGREVAQVWCALALGGAGDPSVDGRNGRVPVLVDHEDSFDGLAEVLRPDQCPG